MEEESVQKQRQREKAREKQNRIINDKKVIKQKIKVENISFMK